MPSGWNGLNRSLTRIDRSIHPQAKAGLIAVSYSDFSLNQIKEQFGLDLIEDQVLFPNSPLLPLSDLLKQLMERYIPLANWIVVVHPPGCGSGARGSPARRSSMARSR